MSGTHGIRRLWIWLGRTLVTAVLIVACLLLYRQLRDLRLADVEASFRAMPTQWLVACLALTALNYFILMIYEALAVHASGFPLPFRRVALASFAGFVISYNIGAVLGGTPVRLRLYSSWGMPPGAIVRLMVVIGATFWFGIFALAGVIFIVDPFPVPAALNLGMSDVRPIGWLLLGITVIYVGLSVVRRTPIQWRGHEFQIPSAGTVLLQIAVSAADLVVAAACLYVLMPDSVGLTFPQFLGVYVLAVVAVIFTHVPGGLGVFELIILELATAAEKHEILVSLLAFRVIYYLIPLAFALMLLAANEWLLMRRRRSAARLNEA